MGKKRILITGDKRFISNELKSVIGMEKHHAKKDVKKSLKILLFNKPIFLLYNIK